MATNRHAQIRYNTLDKCFRNPGRNYTIQDLLEECNKAVFEFDKKSHGIQRRQFFEDVRYMKSSQGWSIILEENLKIGSKKVYRYEDLNFSINNQPLNESDANQLKAAIFSLARMENSWADELSVRLRENFNMKDDPRKIIEFEENEFLKGKDFISELYNAILYKKVLRIDYQSFKSEDIQLFEIHPYYLKQYNNRWFLFGQDIKYPTLSNLALDRINHIEETTAAYIDVETDFKEYFEDVLGVTVNDSNSSKVILMVASGSIDYIETKALHGSQKVKEKVGDSTLVELNVIPNYELISRILSYGQDIEIIEPLNLRNQIKEQIELMVKMYSK